MSALNNQLSAAKIRQKLLAIDVAHMTSAQKAWLDDLANDSRKTVQQSLKTFHNKRAHFEQKQQEFAKRFQYEQHLWQQSKQVAGVDEVGRGPLAGPVVAACVMISPDFDLVAVNDSKQLTKHQRAELYPQILQQAYAVGIGVVDNRQIDELNIYQASRHAMKQAVQNCVMTRDCFQRVQADHLLVDAMEIDVPIEQTKLIKGDAKSNSIAAASIVAKVYRDRLMEFLATQYPQYGWEQNDGYGTKAHLAAMQTYGISPLHRRSFSPVAKILGAEKN